MVELLGVADSEAALAELLQGPCRNLLRAALPDHLPGADEVQLKLLLLPVAERHLLLPQGEHRALPPLPATVGLVGSVMKERRSLHVPHAASDSRYVAAHEAAYYEDHSVHVLPLIWWDPGSGMTPGAPVPAPLFGVLACVAPPRFLSQAPDLWVRYLRSIPPIFSLVLQRLRTESELRLYRDAFIEQAKMSAGSPLLSGKHDLIAGLVRAAGVFERDPVGQGRRRCAPWRVLRRAGQGRKQHGHQCQQKARRHAPGLAQP